MKIPGTSRSTDSMGDGHGEQRVGLPANWMWMGDRRVLPGPLSHVG